MMGIHGGMQCKHWAGWDTHGPCACVDATQIRLGLSPHNGVSPHEIAQQTVSCGASDSVTMLQRHVA